MEKTRKENWVFGKILFGILHYVSKSIVPMLQWMCHEKREKLNADKENGAHGSLH